MYTLIIQKIDNGLPWKQGDFTLHSPNRDCSLGQKRSHLVCPGERSGTHETLSWGGVQDKSN